MQGVLVGCFVVGEFRLPQSQYGRYSVVHLILSGCWLADINRDRDRDRDMVLSWTKHFALFFECS